MDSRLKMSSSNNDSDEMMVCACCGIAEIDDIKLKDCDDCDLVRYCSDECREEHKSQHEEACNIRAAGIRDELLFKQPESTHLGECPICCLPLPLDMYKNTMYNCCSKLICRGCNTAYQFNIANQSRERRTRLEKSCPFCRKPLPKTDEDETKLRMKRVAVNNPTALCHEGMVQYSNGNYFKAFGYYKKAADLGVVEAHYRLACLYGDGKGVEEHTEKEIYHLEKATIGGHPDARYRLGKFEWINKQNYGRAVKHWIISATQGDEYSMKALLEIFEDGLVSEKDLTATLRAHKAAVDAAKSPIREVVERAWEKCRKRA